MHKKTLDYTNFKIKKMDNPIKHINRMERENHPSPHRVHHPKTH